jgi:hypothetical protein
MPLHADPLELRRLPHNPRRQSSADNILWSITSDRDRGSLMLRLIIVVTLADPPKRITAPARASMVCRYRKLISLDNIPRSLRYVLRDTVRQPVVSQDIPLAS